MILFFYGPDTFTLSREVKKMKAGFSGAFEELETGSATDNELKIRLHETLESQGLFAKQKLVILKNFLTNIKDYPKCEEYLLEYAATTPGQAATRGGESERSSPPREGELEGVMLVFLQSEKFDKRLKFFKTLQKEAQAKEFVIPSGTDLEIWVANYLQDQGFTIENAAVAEFVNLMGRNEEDSLYDLWQVSAELEKLMLLKTSPSLTPARGGESERSSPPREGELEGVIALADVRELVRPNISQNVFTLTNLFAEGRGAEAQKLLNDFMGMGPAYELKTQTIQIIGALASQIRSLLLVKDLEQESPAGIAATLGWKEGRVWINSKLAGKFSKEKLISMMRDLRALDLRLKTSEEPPKLLLSLFLQKAKV